jgi:hypothetical protein
MCILTSLIFFILMLSCSWTIISWFRIMLKWIAFSRTNVSTSFPCANKSKQLVLYWVKEREKKGPRTLRWDSHFLVPYCGNGNVGCNVLLIQKSILRDAVSDLALHFLAKLGILAIKDIERDEIEFISKVWRVWRSHSKFFEEKVSSI